jgi:hypothetical protein
MTGCVMNPTSYSRAHRFPAAVDERDAAAGRRRTVALPPVWGLVLHRAVPDAEAEPDNLGRAGARPRIDTVTEPSV